MKLEHNSLGTLGQASGYIEDEGALLSFFTTKVLTRHPFIVCQIGLSKLLWGSSLTPAELGSTAGSFRSGAVLLQACGCFFGHTNYWKAGTDVSGGLRLAMDSFVYFWTIPRAQQAH